MKMPGKLDPGFYCVATPIGNLEDLSPRARRVLESADHILAEDTRRTRQLLQALGIETHARIERCDQAVEHGRSLAWGTQIAESQEVWVLVSDAGTPGVSDPGSVLVQEVLRAGGRVCPIPGPSAVTALLSVAPFAVTPYVFCGFFPREAKEQTAEIEAFWRRCAQVPVAVWFESPHRIVEALTAWAEAVEKKPNAEELRVWVGKELTKVHERFFGGSAPEVQALVRGEIEREGPLGEWCFAVYHTESYEELPSWELAAQCLREAGVSDSLGARVVSQKFGVAKNAVYRWFLAQKPLN